MDISLHHLTECRVDTPMSGQEWLAGKCHRHDVHAKVAAAIASTGVADVLVAFVIDRQFTGVERFQQTRTHAFDALAHGRT